MHYMDTLLRMPPHPLTVEQDMPMMGNGPREPQTQEEELATIMRLEMERQLDRVLA